MKKYNKFIILFICLISLCSSLFAVESKSSDDVPIDEKTGFPVILNKPFVVFDYGVTSSWITRIVKQTGRSNFVFDDFLLGAYVNMKTENMAPLDSMVRLSVFYPVSYKFNRVPQPPVNMLNFAVDLFAAPVVNLSFWNYVTFDLGAGLHCLYQHGDRWHYVDLGLGTMARVNMPVARRWSVFVDGLFSLDYGNLGTNRRMEPYDVVWQYQLSVGFRYSKRAPNKYSYIPSRRTYEEDIQALKEKEEAKRKAKEEKEHAKMFF